MRIDGRVLFSGMIAAVFAAALITIFADEPQGRMSSLIVVGPGFVLSAIQLWGSLFDRKAPCRIEYEGGQRQRALVLIAVFAAFIIGTILVGLPVAALVLVFLYLSAYQRAGVFLSAALSIFLSAAVFLLLRFTFGIGLIGGLMG